MRIDRRADGGAAEGHDLDADEACRPPATCAEASWPTSGSRTRCRPRRARPRSSTRATPSGRSRAPGIEVPPAASLRARSCGTTGSAPRPRPVPRPLVRGRRQRQDGRHHRRVQRHRPRRGAQDRPRRRHPAARRAQRRQAGGDASARSSRSAGRAYVYPADLSDMDAIDALAERMFADHAASTCSSTTPAARSDARSRSAYDRFHDFERTVQLNYLGTIKLIIRLLPHMRERGRGHVVNVSSIGVQTNPPRFSPTSPRRRRWTRSRASSPPRRSATASPSRRSTCRWCGRR